MSLNKVMLIGRLGSDPELKQANGKAVVTLSVATSEKWTDKNTGVTNENTEWSRVVLWGKLAEVVAKYSVKGELIYVEGRLQTRTWENKEGVKQYTTEVIASAVKFLSSKSTSNEESSGNDPFVNDADEMPF